MTYLFHKINNLFSRDFDKYSATSLSSAVEQLTSKLEKIKHLDNQLFKLYTGVYANASEIETDVMDAEELYDDILVKIVHALRYT